MSTTYSVLLSLRTEGDLTAKVGSVGAAADKADTSIKKMGSSFESIGAKMGNAMSSVASAIATIGVGVAKWGGAALFAGAAYGVGQLNNQLEQTQISLGAIYQAQGLAGTFADGMATASSQIAKMKTDVMTLPGTFGQLAQLMQTTATTGIAAGMNEDQLRKFAGRTMLTASIVAPTIDNNLLSKEIVNLLAGKAGTHNILGLRLGLQGEEAKKFNAMAPEQRLAELNKIFDKYKDATDAIAHSWRAQFTTLKDIALYQVLQPITQPLFEHVKADLVKVNDYFLTHKTQVEHYVNIVAYRVAGAWDSVVSTVEKLKPVFEWLGNKLESFHASDITKAFKEAGELALGLKIGSAAVPLAASAIGSLAGGGGIAVVSVASFLGATAIAALAGTGLAIADNLSDPANHPVTVSQMTAVYGDMAGISKDFHQVAYDMKELVGTIGGIGASLLAIGANMGRATSGALSDIVDRLSHPLGGNIHSYSATDFNGRTYDTLESHFRTLDEHLAANPTPPKQRDSAVTNIKVDIVVKGSDDPTRVARKTLEAFEARYNDRQKRISQHNPPPLR